jgi:hypothetical protein
MVSSLKMEIEKFNGNFFELRNLNMEDLLMDRDYWIMVDPGTAPIGNLANYWKKLDRKAKSTI